MAWSYGLEDSRISLFQYATQILSGSCDVDVGFGSNLGQWTPPTPTGLSASTTGIQIDLDQLELGIRYHQLHAKPRRLVQRTLDASLLRGGHAYADSGLQIGTTYYYEVSANNGGGNSAFSSSVSATTMKTMIWTGGEANANWSTAANWGGAAPVAGCDLVFDGSTGLNNNNDLAAGTQFGNLTFNAGAGAFILNGNSLTLTGTIANNSANTQTINLSLGGTDGLAKTGAGMVILSSANSFTGGTLVTGGTLQVATPTALLDGSNLSIGANVLTAFAAPIVPAAIAAAAAVNAPVHASVTPAALAIGPCRSSTRRFKCRWPMLAGARRPGEKTGQTGRPSAAIKTGRSRRLLPMTGSWLIIDLAPERHRPGSFRRLAKRAKPTTTERALSGQVRVLAADHRVRRLVTWP